MNKQHRALIAFLALIISAALETYSNTTAQPSIKMPSLSASANIDAELPQAVQSQSARTRVVIVMVIDQFSAHYIAKLRPFLKGGIGMLAREGVQFVNAFYDHAMPTTGPGHYLLSTGTYGSVNGIVNNKWFDKDGNAVACDDDTAKNAAVFDPEGGLYKYGKSARLSMVDNLSDQLVMHSYPQAGNKVWSLSLKSRAAIAMAGRLGKALWLDEQSGYYTSSKAYFKELPDWLKKFNKQLSAQRTLLWNLAYPAKSPAYAFDNIQNYKHGSFPVSFLGKPIFYRPAKKAAHHSLRKNAHNGHELLSLLSAAELYSATPQANKDLLDLALTTFEKNYSDKKEDRFILWLGLSSLDKIGHAYGPQSLEAIDMIYHIDLQLKKFIEKIYERVTPDKVLFVLTADHGIQPIPELLQEQGFDLARRYVGTDLMHGMNTMIELKYGLSNFFYKFREPQFYANHKIVSTTNQDTLRKIYHDSKEYLTNLPGIRHAWTFEELQNTIFPSYDLDKYLARLLYKGRSGQLFYSVNPYTLIDTHPGGTSHITEYAYDTQVPLIFYQKGRFAHKRITKNVYIPQICVTLATLLDVPRPSAATAQVLPGLKL